MKYFQVTFNIIIINRKIQLVQGVAEDEEDMENQSCEEEEVCAMWRNNKYSLPHCLYSFIYF